MALGPGKYDEIAWLARSRTGGGVILIVFDGHLGSGFSVQATLAQIGAIPKVLREVADKIECDQRKMA